jgi:two-component system CitB family response regulator
MIGHSVKELATELSATGARPTPSIRTVVVDDDFRVASLHATYVEQVPGFTVVGQAHSAAAVFDAVLRLQPHLLLLDLYLPDQHGLEVLRRLRAPGAPDIDVIVITAANDIASVRAAMQGGVIHYLLKPFDFRVLRQKLLAYHAMRNQLAIAHRADQHGVDRLFAVHGHPAGSGRESNHAQHTLDAVESLLANHEEGLSANEVAAILGISRATAQRYLTKLESLSRATISQRYRATGRPEHRYRWNSPG